MNLDDKVRFARRQLFSMAGVGAAAVIAKATRVNALEIRPRAPGCEEVFGWFYDCSPGQPVYPGDPSSPRAPNCFLKGTLIATAICDRNVEDILPGDILLTQDGLQQVQRMRHITFKPVPPEAIPIHICRGAIGPAQPFADLYLSPQHALLIDGKLVTARSLVNGYSIREIRHLDSVEYFHIEMEQHQIIYANGAPCETFMERNAEFSMPVLDLSGGWAKIASRARSALSPWLDWRHPVDLIRDRLETGKSS